MQTNWMSKTQLHNQTILVVDDTATFANLFLAYFKPFGFKILAAQDGAEAIRLAREAQPEIILLDIMLPDMDGFEACRRLKADPLTRQIPVIFITALADIDSKVKGFEAGGVDYVTKPIEWKEILARVSTHLTLRELQKDLQKEITAHQKAEERLRQYALELRANNEELEAFAHTVAHNIKNLLGAITGLGEFLVSDYDNLPADTIESSLSTIAQSSRKASNIVDELLVLAGARQAEVQARPLKMAEIVAEAQQRLAPLILQSQATVILPTQWPTALGHAPWVEEVWLNYISNAIKYGSHPPQVRLGATRQGSEMIRFWVKDNGPGLKAEEKARLFVPFTRLKQVGVDGNGLGLSIVQRIVERLGGEVGVEPNPAPEQGSTFYFTLPAQP